MIEDKIDVKKLIQDDFFMREERCSNCEHHGFNYSEREDECAVNKCKFKRDDSKVKGKLKRTVYFELIGDKSFREELQAIISKRTSLSITAGDIISRDCYY